MCTYMYSVQCTLNAYVCYNLSDLSLKIKLLSVESSHIKIRLTI